MSLYAILLFVHVSSAICLFIGMGIWLFGSTVIAGAERVEQVRAIAAPMLMVQHVVPVSALLVIVAGITMTLTAWGFQTGWIAVALGSLVLIGPIGTWVIDPKVRAIAALAHTLPDGPLPRTLAERTQDRVLPLALRTMTGMLFGIVFLMTTKPALTSAIGAMVISALLGLVSGVAFTRARPACASKRGHQHEEDAA
jgi:multisubunit Na+/H+ antiporter MnhF subunit